MADQNPKAPLTPAPREGSLLRRGAKDPQSLALFVGRKKFTPPSPAAK